ncbi:MAG TPA: hypothetical protein VJ723_02340, partial [Candidatus Angelobacter sp.]|nr:hypothetical protein [Candidatus Angelobacter sp.]
MPQERRKPVFLLTSRITRWYFRKLERLLFVAWLLTTAGFDAWAIKTWGVIDGPKGSYQITLLGYTLIGIWLLVALASSVAYVAFQRLRGVVKPNTPSVQKPESEAQHYSVPEPPEALMDALAKGECVAFIGAGLSAPAGFP